MACVGMISHSRGLDGGAVYSARGDGRKVYQGNGIIRGIIWPLWLLLNMLRWKQLGCRVHVMEA